MRNVLSTYRARAALGAAGLAAMILGVATVGYVARPDLLYVEHITFSGNGHAAAGELRHLADVPNGTRIWEVDPERVAADVERHPWVRRAEVRRVFPDRVEVVVEEHAPTALLHFDRMLYVNAHGEAFLEASPLDLDYPSITGVSPDLARAHPELPGRVVKSALHLLGELDTRGLVSRDLVDEVHFSRTRGFTVHTRGSRLLFALEGLDGQLERLGSLLASGTVDLDRPFHVDLGPRSVAIVRPLGSPGEG